MPDREMMVKLAAACLEALLFAGAYWLFGRYAPARDPSVTEARLAELRARYAWFDFAMLPLFFAFTGLFVWGFYEALRPIVAWYVARRGPAEFTISAEPAALLLPSLFLGMFAAAVPMGLVTRAWLGPQRFAEYMTYSRYGQGFDAQRVLVVLAVGIVPAALVVAALFADQYTRVTPTELVVNPFWGLTEHRRALSDVTGVYEVQRFTAPAGNAVRKPYHLVRFRDGSTWATRDGGRTPRPREDRPVVRYIAERAGVSVQVVASPPE